MSKHANKMPDMRVWRENRYRVFNDKINHFKEHPKYEWLRKYADDAMRYNEGAGYYMIKAADFIERIEKASLEYIADWLDEKKISWNGLKLKRRFEYES